MSNGSDNTKNIDLVAGRTINEIIHKHEDLDVFDYLNNTLAQIKKNDSKAKPDHFFGLNFYTITRSLDYLDKYYGKNSKFYKEVIRTNSKDITPETGVVFECKVHIPEITGILPRPDINKIIGAHKKQEDDKLDPETQKSYDQQRPQRLADGFPEIIKLAMYPSFFYYGTEKGQPMFGHFCKVKFSDAMPTRGAGIYLETLASKFR